MSNVSLYQPPTEWELNNATVNGIGMSGTDVSGSGFDFTSFATPLKLAGIGLKAFGQYEEGQQIAGAYEYNAALATQSLDLEEYQIGVAEKDFAGNQAAAYAKAGVTMSGSPMDVMLKSATNFELDKQVARYNTESKVNMMRYEAEQAKKQASFNVGSTLLSGAESLLPLLVSL